MGDLMVIKLSALGSATGALGAAATGAEMATGAGAACIATGAGVY